MRVEKIETCMFRMPLLAFMALWWGAVAPSGCYGQAPTGLAEASESRNDAEEVERFRDKALGLFIHWSIDVQYGSVISHSLVGADEDYRKRYFEQLPQTFNPTAYEPKLWAELARACGFKYAVLTAKHHNGFCLFPTKTTPFNVMETRYGRDLVGPYCRAFRDEGLGVGLYFSPEDFWFLHQQGRTPARAVEHGYTQPSQNRELDKHNQRQMRELLAACGPIDIWFFDSKEPPKSLKEIVWDENPSTIVTRGAMATPEQALAGASRDGPWEACFTMGEQWQFRGTNEKYKSATELIQWLIETRALGGNLLLNIGPTASGVISAKQEALMRELGLWLFINGEAIYQVRPWDVDHDGDVWFTKAKDDSAVYLFLTNQKNWTLGQRREFVVRGVKTTAESQASVLGHGGKILEYEPTVDPTIRMEQRDGELHLSVMRAQRIYNDKRWPNPIVVKITNPEISD